MVNRVTGEATFVSVALVNTVRTALFQHCWGYIPLFFFKSSTTSAIGGRGSLETPPCGTARWSGNLGRCSGRLCCISTSWPRLARAASILGLAERSEVRLTARSRNSLAKAVWTVRPESPPKAASSSLLSKSAMDSHVGPLLPVCGVEMMRLAASLGTPDVERFLRSVSMLPRRDSIWSILRSLGLLVGRFRTVTASAAAASGGYILLRGDENTLTRLLWALAGTGRSTRSLGCSTVGARPVLVAANLEKGFSLVTWQFAVEMTRWAGM